MDIYKFALKMEKDGEKFYREMAANCEDKGMNAILTMLADEEVVHYEILQQMQTKASPEHKSPDTFAGIKNLFEEMKTLKDGLKIDKNQAAMYAEARDIEKEAVTFYEEKAKEMSNEDDKALLLKLAKEEQRHYIILDNLADFVGQAEPGRWLENAEWRQMNDY